MPRARLKDWEGVAAWLLDSCGFTEPPIDPFALADLWGFDVVRTTRSCLRGNVISVDDRKSRKRQRFDVAHELAHWALHECGHDAYDESAAHWVAGAVLLPQAAFKRDLSEVDWRLTELPDRYQVSWESLVKRVPQVVGAVVTMFDNGRITWRARSAWLEGAAFDPTAATQWEWDLLHDCRERRQHTHASNLVDAYFLESDGWERIFVVAGIDEWETLTRAETQDVG
ncbi:MAG: ImmA/IrrE family metallo-endopeptidase [Myxococcota bacterium]